MKVAVQAAGNSMSINFNNNTANALGNTGHPYANALLGNFNDLNQPTIGIYQGQYRSTNVEWYVQDNWKVNRKLTLDYGLRFNWIQPQFDQRLQGGFFNPSAFTSAQTAQLYQRSCKPGTFPCSGNNVVALNPITGALSEAFNVGRVVPGSGNSFNGMQRPGVDIERGGFQNRGIQYGPAFGFAYDLFGDQKTVIRGGYRIGYDRVSGNNVAFPSVEQPPTFINPRFDFGNLDTVGTGTGDPALGTLSLRGADFGGHIPNVQSFSLQVQHDLGFDTVLSVGYVGTLSRHLPEDINLNATPYGALFTRAAQDPSRFADTLLKSVVNNWQVTGLTTFQSGVPTELGFGIPDIDVNQRISGSWTEGPRVVITGDAQTSVTGGSEQGGSSLDITKLSLPKINPGPQARSLIRRPGINVTDLSVFKSFPLGGEGQRYIQLRLEMFNAFNHAQFDNFNTGLTWDITDLNQYGAKLQGSPQTIRNTRTGVSPASGRLGRALGEFNGQPDFVSGNRRIQLAVKIYF
jgi:hypothetical protein